MNRILAAAALALLALLAGTLPVRAEVSEVKLVLQNGSNYLPMLIMREHKLVEKHLKTKGLEATKVTWARLAGPAAIVDSFLAGAVDFAAQGIPSTAVLWDRTRNGIRVKAVSALVASNIWLMTRKPELKSLRDISDKERIAVPSVKTSSQALFIWAAAEKEFGPGQWGKLDHVTVSVPHPEAMAAVMSPRGEITIHAATSPYADIERKVGLHAVTDLYTVHGGPVSGLNLVTTETFRGANPATYDAVVSAFQEALAWLNADKRRAAKFYLEATKDKMPLADLEEILLAPDYIFDQVPRGIDSAMAMMHKSGILKSPPTSWKDMYMPETHKLPGN